jgi:hypothetical protein
VDDSLILDTAAALDRAMARLAISVAGNRERAEELLVSVGRGGHDQASEAFRTEAAALMRARLLLANASRRQTGSLRKRIAA